MIGVRVYEPPCVSLGSPRPPFADAKRGGSGGVPFPGSSGWTLRPMDSRLRGNDEGAAGMIGCECMNPLRLAWLAASPFC